MEKTSKKLLFVIPPKVHLLDINGPAHIFYEAQEYGAEIDLHFISMGPERELPSSAGLHFSQLELFSEHELEDRDYVFVPGLDFVLLTNPDFQQSHGEFLDWLCHQYNRGAQVCSICTGAYLLAAAGLLDGKVATTHWKYAADFAKRYPRIELQKNCLFVVEDRLYTSAGVASGIDLSLFILEQDFGTKFATDVAKEVVIYFRRGEFDPQLSVFLQYRNHLNDRIHRAQDYLTKQLGHTFTIDDIAETVNMSSRNLTRLFKKTTGITIGNYLDKLRVERAVQLLIEGNKVDFVAAECGLKSSNQLRSLLKKYKGQLPSEILSLS